MQNNDIKKVHDTLVFGIKDFFKKNKFNKAVIGVSGGIDSALSAKLVADAIGKNNIHALIMPLKGLSSEENIQDAVEFCTLNGISYSLIFINDFTKEFEKVEWKQNKAAKMNTISRVRGVLLYNCANSNNAMVIGTSNKTEILLGYFTKYGDGAVDVEVIGDLFKTEVRELARFLKIPNRIVSKAPTAELYPGQTDEKEIGVNYDNLDRILKIYIEGGYSVEKIIKKGFDKKIAEKVVERVKANEHKRKVPMVLRAY